MNTVIRVCSSTGNDRNDGREAPVASLSRARELVRAAPERGCQPLLVELAAGTWELDRTLELGAADSGAPGAPVCWRAAPGARVAWSGGRRLTGWIEDRIGALRVWTLRLLDPWRFSQLFVDGVRRPRSSLPDHPGLADGVARLSSEDAWFRFAAQADSRPGVAGFVPGDLEERWIEDGIELLILKYWCDFRVDPQRIDAGRNLVSFPIPSGLAPNDWNLGKLVDEHAQGARYRVENVRAGLRHPGQWHLSRDGLLSYLPRPGEEMDATVVVAPRLDVLVHLRDAAHVRFEGLDLVHSEWQRPAGNPGSAQAQFHLPGAVVLERAADCAIHACRLQHLATYGIEVCRGSQRNSITCCRLADLGAGGVKINHDGPHNRSDSTGSGAFDGLPEVAARWEGTTTCASRTLVSDCVISGYGRVYPSACGIWIGDSGHNRIRRNRIEDGYYTAISVGWTWGYHATRTVGNRIEGNRIAMIGQGVLSDMGGIYLLGPAPGTVVSGNHVSGVRCHGYGEGGIYPDEGSSFLVIEGNTVLSGGLSTHFGRDMLVKGNLFVSQTVGLGVGRAEPYRAFHAEGNVIVAAGEAVRPAASRCTFARNCYAPGPAKTFAGRSFAAWQAEGRDAGSILADPLLQDAGAGAMTMRGDSPALGLGFRMPAEGAGPRYADGVIPATSEELPAEEGADPPIIEARIEVGGGAAWLAQAANPDPDPEAANRYAWRDADSLSPFTLVVRNRGGVHASGRLRLGWVGTPGTILGPDTLGYDLEPGAATFLDFQAQAGATSTLLEAMPQAGIGCLPTALHFMRRPRTVIRRLRGGLRLGEVIAALASARSQPLDGVDAGLAQLRIGWTGTHLAVHARVTDPDPAHCSPPWAGSDVELFTAMPGSNGRSDALPRRGNAQLFLLPAVGGNPAAAMVFEPQLQPAPDIALDSRLVPGGYELWALIPAARARLETGSIGTIVCEAVLRPVPPGSSRRRHTNLFGAVDGNDNGAWAMAEIRDDG